MKPHPDWPLVTRVNGVSRDLLFSGMRSLLYESALPADRSRQYLPKIYVRRFSYKSGRVGIGLGVLSAGIIAVLTLLVFTVPSLVTRSF